jgi:hypothetical protein
VSRKTIWAALGVAAAVTLACSTPGTNSADNDDSGGGGDDFFASFADFETVNHSGDGDGVIELDGITQALVTASHTGEHYFSITGLDANNEPTGDLLVNALGAYDGVTALGMSSTEPVRLEITADGPWTISLSPIASAPALPDSGAGDGVFKYEGDAGTWHVVHSGAHYFSLWEHTGADFEMGLLATEIGAYDGEVAVKKGPSLIVIQADGDWTITAK